jgi:hypothetical protein
LMQALTISLNLGVVNTCAANKAGNPCCRNENLLS